MNLDDRPERVNLTIPTRSCRRELGRRVEIVNEAIFSLDAVERKKQEI